jgi:hypothetical protein
LRTCSDEIDEGLRQPSTKHRRKTQENHSNGRRSRENELAEIFVFGYHDAPFRYRKLEDRLIGRSTKRFGDRLDIVTGCSQCVEDRCVTALVGQDQHGGNAVKLDS